VHLRQHARSRGSRIELVEPVFHLWMLRDGRPVRMEMFLDEPAALAAAQGDA